VSLPPLSILNSQSTTCKPRSHLMVLSDDFAFFGDTSNPQLYSDEPKPLPTAWLPFSLPPLLFQPCGDLAFSRILPSVIVAYSSDEIDTGFSSAFS